MMIMDRWKNLPVDIVNFAGVTNSKRKQRDSQEFLEDQTYMALRLLYFNFVFLFVLLTVFLFVLLKCRIIQKNVSK